MKWKKEEKKCYYNLNVEFYVQILYREIDLGVTNNDFTKKNKITKMTFYLLSNILLSAYLNKWFVTFLMFSTKKLAKFQKWTFLIIFMVQIKKKESVPKFVINV